MFLHEVADKKELNIFVTENFGGSFLQSWEWGEFQESLDRRVWRVGVYRLLNNDKDINIDELNIKKEELKNNEELLAVATVVEHPLGLGLSYLYCPYGPVYSDVLSVRQKENSTHFIMSDLRDITIKTKNEEEIFVRVEPRLKPDEVGNFFINEGWVKAHAVQPQDTQVVELNESEAWLLRQMHPKTRYNIRLAQRKNVKVREAMDDYDIDIFWYLMQMTTSRDGFRAHERSYYKKLWNFFREYDIEDQMHLTIKILIAEFEKKPIAAIMLGFFGGRVTYLHGASNHNFRQLMAPHLLQWEGMRLGIKYGYSYYDFNGIKPVNRELAKNDKAQSWEGITRFKKSFGGEEINYIGAWDWPYYKTRYRLYRLVHKLLVR